MRVIYWRLAELYVMAEMGLKEPMEWDCTDPNNEKRKEFIEKVKLRCESMMVDDLQP